MCLIEIYCRGNLNLGINEMSLSFAALLCNPGWIMKPAHAKFAPEVSRRACIEEG
jgi:hypothetical protein